MSWAEERRWSGQAWPHVAVLRSTSRFCCDGSGVRRSARRSESGQDAHLFDDEHDPREAEQARAHRLTRERTHVVLVRTVSNVSTTCNGDARRDSVSAPAADVCEPPLNLCEGPVGDAVDLDDALPPPVPLVLVLVLVSEPAQQGCLVGDLSGEAPEGPHRRDEARESGSGSSGIDCEVELELGRLPGQRLAHVSEAEVSRRSRPRAPLGRSPALCSSSPPPPHSSPGGA